MPNKSLSRSGLLTYQKYSSLLAGNDPFIPGAYDLLETEILTGSQASVTFSSLNSTYAADYQHLQLRIVSRQDAAGDEPLGMYFNADNSSSYSYHRLDADGSTVYSAAHTSDTSIERIGYSGNSTNSNSFGATIIDILDAFKTTKYTTVRSLSGVHHDAPEIGISSGLYQKTDAVDSITLMKRTGTADLLTDSRFSLYGLKGA